MAKKKDMGSMGSSVEKEAGYGKGDSLKKAAREGINSGKKSKLDGVADVGKKNGAQYAGVK